MSCWSGVESAVFGDSAGGAAVAAGLPALVERKVEAVRAEPAVAAVEQAGGMVGAEGHPPGRAVTVFALVGVTHCWIDPWWRRGRVRGRGL
jgi:hypothetical protein